MKNYEEIIDALKDGKKLCSSPNGSKFIHLVDHHLVDDKGHKRFLSFMPPENWRIYREPPQWYDNIPPEGIPCWVKNNKSGPWGRREIIRNYEKGNFYPYIGWDSQWTYATPMTKSEIHVWLNNAPEG